MTERKGRSSMEEISTVEEGVRALTAYGIRRGLIEKYDAIWAQNMLLDLLKYEPGPEFNAIGLLREPERELEEILKFLLDNAASRGLIEDSTASRDLFDTRLMGVLTPKPFDVVREFWAQYRKSPELATNYFYRLSRDSDYIRTYRVRKDRRWVTHTRYGDLDISINLSKPEKDPKAIAAALTKKQSAYPRCLLCPENEGYAGRAGHPARQTLRLIPLSLGGERWYMQYSPYVYYNEHCIVLSAKHEQMRIDRGTFHRLLEFTILFPHYTIGSNADLPIVGGSILTHEHFQGGRYEFAMTRAEVREKVRFKGFEDISAGIVNWPLSVIRLDGADPERVELLSAKILDAWRDYSDPDAGILAETDGERHNTITPIARRRGAAYEMDLVLRNNRTTKEHPLGIFHPHEELHHIKKENIGLIEVMGLAVLPSRLLREMELLERTILDGTRVETVPALASHAAWAEQILRKYPEYAPSRIKINRGGTGAADGGTGGGAAAERLRGILREEIGLVFSQVLEHCGVFKEDAAGKAAFGRFLAAADRKEAENQAEP